MLTPKQRDVLTYEQNGSPKPYCDRDDEPELNELVWRGWAVKVPRSYLPDGYTYFCSTPDGRKEAADG